MKSRIDEGRYKNASEVIRAGLRLLEERENKVQALKNAIQEGIDSGINEDFDADEFLKKTQSMKEWTWKIESARRIIWATGGLNKTLHSIFLLNLNLMLRINLLLKFRHRKFLDVHYRF